MIEPASQKAVEAIGQRGNDQDGERPLVVAVVNRNDEEGQKSQAQESELVGDGEDAAGHGKESYSKSGESREIVVQGAADLALKEFEKRRNGAAGFVERDAFDAAHGEKQRGQADALSFGMQDLSDEIVEGVQVDAPNRNSGGVDVQELAPEFFFRAVQADNHN